MAARPTSPDAQGPSEASIPDTDPPTMPKAGPPETGTLRENVCGRVWTTGRSQAQPHPGGVEIPTPDGGAFLSEGPRFR